MTPAEAQMLLGIAASFDNRKPNEEAAVAWSHALAGVRFVDARDAVVEHYRTSSEWIMPAQVIAAVRRVRSKRIADHAPLLPPPGLDDEQERRWIREARWRIGNGEVIDCDAAYGELIAGTLPRELMQRVDETSEGEADG